MLASACCWCRTGPDWRSGLWPTPGSRWRWDWVRMMILLLQVVAAGVTFSCTPIAIWDGDGPIWCAEGPKIRIAGVAAREMNGTCNTNQPCPSVGPIDARDRLVSLFGGPTGVLTSGHVKVRGATMTCVSDGPAGGSRTAAWCRSAAVGDLSCAVVRAGGAVRWSRYWRDHQC